MRPNRGGMTAVIITAAVAALIATGTAEAARPTVNRTYLSTYAPTQGQITAATDGTQNYINQWIYWSTTARRRALNNYKGAYEHEAVFKINSENQCWPGPYGPWDSNIPFAYQDTNFDDDEFVQASRAFGTGVSSSIGTAEWYFFNMFLGRNCTTEQVPFKIKTQDSHIGDAFTVLNCLGGFEWCVFGDPYNPRDLTPFSAGWQTPSTENWAYQQLLNPSWESSPSGAHWYIHPTTSSSLAQTWSGTGAHEGPNWLRLGCGGVAGCFAYTDVPFLTLPSDIFNIEFALRCPSTNSVDCPVRILLWGKGGDPVEGAGGTISIPRDDRWYLTKFAVEDFDLHDTLQLQLVNDSPSGVVEFDFGTLHWTDWHP